MIDWMGIGVAGRSQPCSGTRGAFPGSLPIIFPGPSETAEITVRGWASIVCDAAGTIHSGTLISRATEATVAIRAGVAVHGTHTVRADGTVTDASHRADTDTRVDATAANSDTNATVSVTATTAASKRDGRCKENQHCN